jgi:hypothetical protein
MAVWASRNPAAVRQPGLPSRHGIAIRHRCARHPAIYRVGAGCVAVGPAVHRVRAWWIAVRSSAYRAGARRAAVKSAVYLARPGHIPVRGAVGQAWTEVRGELARRSHGRVPGRSGPLLVRLMGQCLTGAVQRLAVIVVLDLDRYGFARSCRLVLFLVGMQGRLIAVIESVGMAPGQAVRVTAEAGVATFHQIPPGP